MFAVSLFKTARDNTPRARQYDEPQLQGLLSRWLPGSSKADLMETTLDAISKHVPGIREKLDWVECSTPLTFERYTKHLQGASFGTKFEGLAVSRGLPEQIAGLYHAGSVGIIMSGWLGAVNYGVIVANDVDAFLMNNASQGSPGKVEAP